MLNVKLRKSDEITKVERCGNSLFLYSEKGILRIKPQTQNIVRVSYTLNDEFSGTTGIGICNEQDFTDWNFEETDSYVTLNLARLNIVVCKETGSVKYYNGEKLLLSEREYESHELDEYEAKKVIVDENTKIEEVDTPDGVKRIIKEATEIFDKNLYRTRIHLKFQDNEKIFGLGQAEEGSLNLRGTTQYIHQANLKIAIPVFISSAGYGFISATGSPAVFSDSPYGSYFHTEGDPEMDFYFVSAEKLDEVIKAYRLLTGKAVMLPRWAFGFMQSQERYETQEEVLEIVKGYRDRGIGIDSLVMDWQSWVGEEWGQKSFDYDRFPDPTAMTNSLHEDHVNFMISVWPNMREITANYNEFLDAKLLLPASAIYDAFNEDARKLYWKQANEGLFSQGVDAWWCDSAEPFCPEWRGCIKPEAGRGYKEFLDAASKYLSTQYCNSYGLVHSQTIYDGQRSTGSNKRVTNLTRNTYVGGQKYGAILWSGDTYASWETLQKQIVAGLNFCATGLPYWTLDIGAFFVKKGDRWFWNGEYNAGLDDLGYRELFVRWFQYGAFLPIFRSHGTDVRREMWLFDSEDNHMFYDALVKSNKLRYTLIPYIYSLAGSVYKDDTIMMKLLAFDFMDDEIAMEIKDEYMFGDILVCPVTNPMYYVAHSTALEGVSKTREVYLPKSCDWFDYYTGEKISGGQTIVAEADIDKMPLYIKSGSIIPMTDVLQNTTEVENAEITVHVYSGKDCEFELYEDSGNGYEYENGDYKLTKFTWNEAEQKLDISSDAEKYKVVIH